MAKQLFEMPAGASSMCAACLQQATHFIIVSYSYGKLTPVCPNHQKLYGG